MKIGIISDIHGNLPGLDACLKALAEEGVDQIVCLGDLVQFGPFPSEVIDLLQRNDIDTVQGNCDRAVAKGRDNTGNLFENLHWEHLAADMLQWTKDQITPEQKKYLKKLPAELRYKVGSRRILCVHGLPGNICGSIQPNVTNEVYDLMLERNSCDILVLGHTHEMLLQPRGSRMIINPGSVGGGTLPGEATVAVLEINEENTTASICWHRIPFDTILYEKKYRHEDIPKTFL
ncbi:MAG: metallophosphoesterase family protein, partial [Candidatus Aegiribacteria sp.]|nr:metallophosphoesterase family protein [Candidatus Aegiribacteria sp.]